MDDDKQALTEMETVSRAVEELHEPDRLMDLLLAHVRAEGAPADLVQLLEAGRTALLAWLGA